MMIRNKYIMATLTSLYLNLQAEYGIKTNILSLGWRSNEPGGSVMTYLAVEAVELSLRSRYL